MDIQFVTPTNLILAQELATSAGSWATLFLGHCLSSGRPITQNVSVEILGIGVLEAVSPVNFGGLL